MNKVALMLLSLLSLNIHSGSLIRLGSSYGGWTVPINLLNSSSVCYCAGAGEDITFDVELINKFGCKVFCFDPTPRAIKHFNNLKSSHITGTKFYSIPDKVLYNLNNKVINNLTFCNFGIWSQDKVLKFYSPKDNNHVSHSIVNLQKTEQYFEAQCFKLSTIMKKFGHTSIDLLKLDIEGAELEVIDDILKEKLNIKCICLEFDEMVGVNLKNNINNKPVKDRILKRINDLKAYGYSLVHRANYADMIFIR